MMIRTTARRPSAVRPPYYYCVPSPDARPTPTPRRPLMYTLLPACSTLRREGELCH